MQVLRAGSSQGLVRLGSTWFRMDLETLEKISHCARVLETSPGAFEGALEHAFEPEARGEARAFLLEHVRPAPLPGGANDRDLSDFLAACRSMTFADYSEPTRTRAEDLERMTRFAAEESPPPLAHAFAGASAVELPGVLNAIAESTFLDRETVSFLNHRVGKRGVPSHGARHPFDALFAWGQGTSAVEAYFDPVRGRALRLPRGPRAEELGKSYWVRLYASYERVQWRYRHSGFYDTLLLDAGHILANVAFVAASWGWCAREASSPRVQPGAAEPLLEEVFFQIELTRAPETAP